MQTLLTPSQVIGFLIAGGRQVLAQGVVARGEKGSCSVRVSWSASSVAATAVADRPAGGEPCLLVFLGTQTKHPLFRMFSDVTVKARAGSPEHAWRCFVMTESTPWLFVFPLATPLPEWPMPRITNPDGSAKPDSTWSTIRYRYRLPPVDLATLPGARFFDWRDGRFVEVTDEVRRGERKVPSRDWGM